MARKLDGSDKSRIPEIPNEILRIQALSGHRNLVARLRRVISQLRLSFVTEDLEDRERPFYRPTKHDLDELDELLFSLAQSRIKKEITLAEAVANVESRWPQIKLASFIDRLTRRRRELESPEPKRTASIEHLERIKNLASGGSPTANDFLRDYGTIRDGKKGRRINWSKHHPLLCEQGSSSIRLENDRIALRQGESLECYAKCLELQIAEERWDRAMRLWRRDRQKRRVLSDWFELHSDQDEEIRSNRRAARRRKARERQRKHRARKKSAQNRVTSNLDRTS